MKHKLKNNETGGREAIYILRLIIIHQNYTNSLHQMKLYFSSNNKVQFVIEDGFEFQVNVALTFILNGPQAERENLQINKSCYLKINLGRKDAWSHRTVVHKYTYLISVYTIAGSLVI